LKFLEKRQGTE